jgi:hypothetical protein
MASLSLKSLAILFVPIAVALGESTPPPPAAPATSSKPVRISLLPPPLEGTISLGIYDAKGKLVRVLHREAELEAFEAGKDALLTTWDGLNDAGERMPAGKYHARGFVVGGVNVEGVGFHFNDWVTEQDSPHIRRIENFTRQGGVSLVLLATLADGTGTVLPANLSGELLPTSAPPDGFDFYDLISPERRNLRVEADKLTLSYSADEKPVNWPELVAPQDASYGRGGTVWVIDEIDRIAVVKQFSRTGEFLRRFAMQPGEPMPKLIRAAESDDKLFLLEENEQMQRLRGLTLLQTKSENGEQVSDWKVDFEKKIIAHQNFTIADGKPVASGGNSPPDKATIKLRANPLEKDAATSLEIAVGFDSAGSFLKTADGLPLQSISDTKSLVRVVIGPRDAKSLDVFQDDSACVEQFRITSLDQMMAFDCGDFELN